MFFLTYQHSSKQALDLDGLELVIAQLKIFELQPYKLALNICRFYHVLAWFLFSSAETELDYYHQKVKAWVALRLGEQIVI